MRQQKTFCSGFGVKCLIFLQYFWHKPWEKELIKNLIEKFYCWCSEILLMLLIVEKPSDVLFHLDFSFCHLSCWFFLLQFVQSLWRIFLKHCQLLSKDTQINTFYFSYCLFSQIYVTSCIHDDRYITKNLFNSSVLLSLKSSSSVFKSDALTFRFV